MRTIGLAIARRYSTRPPEPDKPRRIRKPKPAKKRKGGVRAHLKFTSPHKWESAVDTWCWSRWNRKRMRRSMHGLKLLVGQQQKRGSASERT